MSRKTLSLFRFVLRFSLVSVISFLYSLYQYRKMAKMSKKLPPGPWGFPFVGILPMLNVKNPAKKVYELSKRYGPVFSCRMGGHLTVFINDYDTAKEAFGRHGNKFGGRPKILPFQHFNNGHGVAAAFFENNWKENRRFALSGLKKLGMGKNSGFVMDLIDKEMDAFIDEIDKQNKPLDLSRLFMMYACNIISQVVFAQRFEYDDPGFKGYVDIIEDLFEIADPSSAEVFYDFLTMVPFTQSSRFVNEAKYLRENVYATKRDEHINSYCDEKIRDIVDIYIRTFGESLIGEMTEIHKQNLKYIIGDLFVAGTDTTATALLWQFACVVKFPVLQRNIQGELDRVVGRSRDPVMTDLPKLPYTEATIWEIKRYTVGGPFAVPHSATEDVCLNGYLIPKDTMVIANHWAFTRDPNYYPDPEALRPERFLNEKGKFVQHDKNINISFGIGRRSCIGRELAVTNLSMMMMRLLHRYNISVEGGPENLCVDLTSGLAVKPCHHKLIFSLRG